MEKSISNRFYFDYNATSPLSKKVIDFLGSGDFLFGNPASLHHTGRHSKKLINRTTEYLYKLFGLDKNVFDVVYHSGASEGINAYFKGLAFSAFKEKKKHTFFFCQTDHACVFNLKSDLEALGHEVLYFNVDKNGEFNVDELIALIQKTENPVMNFMAINNETGVVWPWSLAHKIKEETKCLIHVDAVQLVGKVSDWQKLDSSLDAFTFSGHKFGALKGIGFSFIKKGVEISPLIVGGNQQEGRRAGTENALGIHSLKLALEEMEINFSALELKQAIHYLEKHIQSTLGDKGEIVAAKAHAHNLNTLFIVIPGQKAESLSMRFDMEGIDVSTGSACSSGVIKENRVLMAMGYSKEESRSSLRFSFSPFMTLPEAHTYAAAIEKVLKSILKM